MNTDITRRRLARAVTTGLVLALWLAGTPVALAGECTEETMNLGADFQYQNHLGYEGIATLGLFGSVNGPTPPVGDWVTTHCRYIDVEDATEGDFYLRYPIHLPDRAVIKGVSLFVADFNPAGNIWVSLVTRPWNTRELGTELGFTFTDDVSNSDKSINMGALNISINNQSNVYWVDVTPDNSAFPGELCVYGIQVTYDCTDCDVLFGDWFESGDVGAWSSAMP